MFGIKVRFEKYRFLFEELVKRDFKNKYKRTFLGLLWSMLGPLLQLLVMSLVFSQLFKGRTEHFTIYIFAGNLVFSFFRESTNGGMMALMNNSGIITKINTPKYIFLLSKNVSSLFNFGLTLVIFFVFVAIDQVPFTPLFLTLIYPIICLTVFNIGVGLILSALYVFFRDIQYIYDIFTLLLMYLSAIFYPIDTFSPAIQRLFYANPVYAYISYFRQVVMQGIMPSLQHNLLCLFYAIAALGIGALIYKHYNYRFLYYM